MPTLAEMLGMSGPPPRPLQSENPNLMRIIAAAQRRRRMTTEEIEAAQARRRDAAGFMGVRG